MYHTFHACVFNNKKICMFFSVPKKAHAHALVGQQNEERFKRGKTHKNEQQIQKNDKKMDMKTR